MRIEQSNTQIGLTPELTDGLRQDIGRCALRYSDGTSVSFRCFGWSALTYSRSTG
jgi:hypothetical protein